MLSQHVVLQMSKLLTGTNDHYGGVIVEMTTEPKDAAVFVFLLRTLVSHWKQQGKRKQNVFKLFFLHFVIFFDSNHDHSIVFPPINHEGLHITSSPSDDQHQDLKSSNSPPDDNRLVPLSPPQTAGVGGEEVARWVGFGFELLRSKVSGIASSVRNFVGFGGTNWSYSLAANRSFSSVTGVAAALLVWWLLAAVRRRRRRVLVRKESKDHLILLIKEKDEKINHLLQQIAQMNQVLLSLRRDSLSGTSGSTK